MTTPDSNKHTQKSRLTERHQTKLGLEIPAGYFETSRSEIMSRIDLQSDEKHTSWFNPGRIYRLAAIIVLAFFLSWLYFSSNNGTETQFPVKDINLTDSEDIMIESLLTTRDSLDVFTKNYLLEAIVVEAQVRELQIQDMLIDALIIEDDSFDQFSKESLINHLIL